MSRAQSPNADSMLSDFSSTLLNVAAKNQFTEDTIVNISSRKYGTTDNANLSSVLAQIQDDGPAYNESIRNEQRYRHAANTAHSNSDGEFKQQDKRYDSEAMGNDKIPSPDLKKTAGSKVNKFSTWIQLSLILMIGVTAAFVLYHFDARTSNLEQALNGYGDELEGDNTVSGERLLPEIDKLNAAIKSVQEGLLIVKTDYSTLDKKYEVAMEVAIEDALKDGATPVTGSDNRVLDLEAQVLQLKAELTTLKNNIAAPDTDKSVSTMATKQSGLTVNLASLTNAVRAEKLVEELSVAGLKPTIEDVLVNDKRVYRISVSGFEDMDAARLFIDTADKRYGMKGSWVRKS